MPEYSFSESLGRLEEYLTDIGYEDFERRDYSDQIYGDTVDGDEPTDEAGTSSESVNREFLAVEVGVGPDFIIDGIETNRYFQLQASYPLWRDIAVRIPPDVAREQMTIASVEDVPEDHPVRHVIPLSVVDSEDMRAQAVAAVEFLADLESDETEDMIYQLSRIFTNAEVKHVVDSATDDAGITGFTVYHKIFPREDEFQIAEFNDAIERVRMATHQGELFLRYAFDLSVKIGQTAEEGYGTQPTTDHEAKPGDELDPL